MTATHHRAERLRRETIRRHGLTPDEIAKLDWGKTNAQLSRDHGCSPHYYWKLRNRLGIPQHKKGGGRKACTSVLRGADWDVHDAELARRHGFPRGTIGKARARFAPETRSQRITRMVNKSIAIIRDANTLRV